MVSYHWKPLKNHRVQWLPDYKTIEKPLVPMVAGLKTIVKPLLPMVCQTKTIVKPLISMVAFQPFIQWQWWVWKPFKCCNGSNHKANNSCVLAAFGYFLQLFATFGYFWQLLAALGNFWQLLAIFCSLWQTFSKTIEKPSMSMVTRNHPLNGNGSTM